MSEEHGLALRWRVKRGKFTTFTPTAAPAPTSQARARERRDTPTRRAHAKTSSGGKDPPGESDDPDLDPPAGDAGLTGVSVAA
jgi:hypothetical protein